MTVSILFALAFGAYCFKAYSEEKLTRDLIFGIVSVLAGIGLVAYGKAVLKKLKNVSYL